MDSITMTVTVADFDLIERGVALLASFLEDELEEQIANGMYSDAIGADMYRYCIADYKRIHRLLLKNI